MGLRVLASCALIALTGTVAACGGDDGDETTAAAEDAATLEIYDPAKPDGIVITNEDIVDPQPNVDAATGEPIVTFNFTLEGQRKFKQLTAGLEAGRNFVIEVDGEVVSEPVIDTTQYPNGIDAPGAQIQGGFTTAEAEELAASLGGSSAD
jgi:preprotein translocase subunit SecD